MLGIHDYALFLVSGVLLNLTPGQDTLFIIGKSLSGGRSSGVAAALGIAVGSVGHTLAAALGLSVILATSALAFAIVKYAGAAYLLVLGVRLLMSPAAAALKAVENHGGRTGSMRTSFLQGIITNILNPKVALFFLAFLPQFVDTAAGVHPIAFLALGGTFIATGLSWCLVLALAAARLQAWFLRNPRSRSWLDRAVGALFVGLGARLAATR